MALTKAVIINTTTAEQISVMFNPEHYSLSKGNNFAEIGIPGLESPIIQFTRGQSKTLTMDLFFDTYEEHNDVRVYTDRIAQLMNINLITKAPPICLFSWGSLVFPFILTNINKKFDMFLPSGIPVRATLTLSMKEYQSITTQLLATTMKAVNMARAHVATQGETLAGIAAKEYNDPKKWRSIAKANNIDNPRRIEAGQSLKIP